jgi:hypothetical protein
MQAIEFRSHPYRSCFSIIECCSMKRSHAETVHEDVASRCSGITRVRTENCRRGHRMTSQNMFRCVVIKTARTLETKRYFWKLKRHKCRRAWREVRSISETNSKHSRGRRVSKGAFAPCPPLITDIHCEWQARRNNAFAHPAFALRFRANLRPSRCSRSRCRTARSIPECRRRCAPAGLSENIGCRSR